MTPGEMTPDEIFGLVVWSLIAVVAIYAVIWARRHPKRRPIRATLDPMDEYRAKLASDLEHHYTYQYDESSRLTKTLRGRLEATRVQHLLGHYLPTGARVADIGGGPGAHALWMEEHGHSVALLDPIPHHVTAAQEAGINALLGDARALPWGDHTFDAALLGGPLYHLTDSRDRARALREAYRVVRPGGLLFVLALNRYANLIGATLANQLGDRLRIVEEILQRGFSPSNDRMAATTYYHTVPELRQECRVDGVRRIDLHGVTGPGGLLAVAADRYDLDEDGMLQSAVAGAELADKDPELLTTSSVLMAVVRKP